MAAQSEKVLILENVRSTYNVGSMLRSADAADWRTVWLIGLTPAPCLSGDERPPHAQDRAARSIAKTALGAEQSLDLRYSRTLDPVVAQLKDGGYTLVALEQAAGSINLFDYAPPPKLALIVGHEIEGVGRTALDSADVILEIPMRGTKESLNVAVATGIALYHLLDRLSVPQYSETAPNAK